MLLPSLPTNTLHFWWWISSLSPIVASNFQNTAEYQVIREPVFISHPAVFSVNIQKWLYWERQGHLPNLCNTSVSLQEPAKTAFRTLIGPCHNLYTFCFGKGLVQLLLQEFFQEIPGPDQVSSFQLYQRPLCFIWTHFKGADIKMQLSLPFKLQCVKSVTRISYSYITVREI